MGFALQKEIVLLVAWGPAILLQLAHPLVAQAIADHSSFRAERWGRVRRLHRTVDAMLRLCFGTEAEAREVVTRINAIHDRVHGRLPAAAGGFPAGTAYSARDPALLTWVHATLLDMNLRSYEHFVRPLAPGDQDRYCLEASAIAEHLGIPEGRLPRSAGELRRYMDGMLASAEISVTDTARALARAVVYPWAPHGARPAIALMRLTTIGLLPPPLRSAYALPWSSRREALFQHGAGLARTLLPLVPSIIRYWPAARAASRAAGAGCPVGGTGPR